MIDKKRALKWWPHYLLTLAVVMIVLLVIFGVLAKMYAVPDDAPLEIPMPDFGEDIPGPEWIFLVFWAPFWYLKGRLKRYLFIMPLVPILITVFLIFLPYFHKIPLRKIPGLGTFMEKAKSIKSNLLRGFVYAIPSILLGIILAIGVYRSGHQAKVLGCDSCHSMAMGKRMAIPPVDVFSYYKVDRARQIGVGKYRAGKTSGKLTAGGEVERDLGGEAQSYKDANWQMRHMYEPTFTW